MNTVKKFQSPFLKVLVGLMPCLSASGPSKTKKRVVVAGLLAPLGYFQIDFAFTLRVKLRHVSRPKTWWTVVLKTLGAQAATFSTPLIIFKLRELFLESAVATRVLLGLVHTGAMTIMCHLKNTTAKKAA